VVGLVFLIRDHPCWSAVRFCLPDHGRFRAMSGPPDRAGFARLGWDVGDHGRFRNSRAQARPPSPPLQLRFSRI